MRHQLAPESNVLITGVTGLIGGEVLRRLTARGHRGKVWALIRPTPDHNPDERLQERLLRSGDTDTSADRTIAVAGDILQPDWGLSPADRDEIAASVDIIIHNA